MWMGALSMMLINKGRRTGNDNMEAQQPQAMQGDYDGMPESHPRGHKQRVHKYSKPNDSVRAKELLTEAVADQYFFGNDFNE